MKSLVITILFTFLIQTDPPVGIWVYKPDSSSIEIAGKDGKLSGTLISSRNAGKKSGTLLLKDFVYNNRYWQGKFYLEDKDLWVDATLKEIDDLLIIKHTYGMVEKKLHLHRKS